MPQAGKLGGSPVSEILKYALDPNVLKSAIGVATLNAFTQLVIESGDRREYEIAKDKDGFDLLEIQPHETSLCRCQPFRSLRDGESLYH
jgi:uncharacterized protein (DUF4213/DUF364 family)